MPTSSHDLSRRTFLHASAAGLAATSAGEARAGEPQPTPRSRPKCGRVVSSGVGSSMDCPSSSARRHR
jgi:hypothetical protein